MIRVLLLCGVLSVGSAWGQASGSTTGYCVMLADQNLPDSCRTGGGSSGGSGTAPPWTISDTYMRIDPRISAQLDRIEAMLRAICEHPFPAFAKDGTWIEKPLSCPKAPP